LSDKTIRPKYPILDEIHLPADLRKLPESELVPLAAELRAFLLEQVSVTGGHLASSLGAVELTLALHYVFETPRDQIVWDVGHQTYPHKLLTGRRDRFHTLRQLGGLAGFTNRAESEYDPFGAGHASTSISAALGMAVARDARRENSNVIAVIGDGSLTGGMAMEGLNQAGYLGRKLLVILNDNEMSISPNVGAMSGYLNAIVHGQTYNRVKDEVKAILRKIPKYGDRTIEVAHHAEEVMKKAFVPGTLFEELGFRYTGPVDGHSLPQLVAALREAKKSDHPILLHVRTQKGKGYSHAEADPVFWHGAVPFQVETGEVAKSAKPAPAPYTTVFADTLAELMKRDDRIVAISAAMLEGTGLDRVRKQLPERVFDVGICEQHAVTFAGGMAARGMKPVVAIYSTFLQRAYDQIMHDVCLMDLPVVFALDRGGLVGADGSTHHGAFDLTYLRVFPNLILMAPKDANELRNMLATAFATGHPTAIRYPRGSSEGTPFDADLRILPVGKGEVVRQGKDGVVWAIGVGVASALRTAETLAADPEPIDLTVVNARFVKPLDLELIRATVPTGARVMTIEENALMGGFGSAVMEGVNELGIHGVEFLRKGLPDEFVTHGTQAELRHLIGLDPDSIAESARQFFTAKRVPIGVKARGGG
jgi:1-deoxy-D-xylulose-5-phosphate synthase